MKKSKMIISLMLTIAMFATLTTQVTAAERTSLPTTPQEYIELRYEIFDEYGVVVERGTLGLGNSPERISFPSITLQSGQTVMFKNPSDQFFYVSNGTYMFLTFALNRKADIEVKCWKASSSSGSNPTLWKDASRTWDTNLKSEIWVTDATTYYSPGVKNASINSITLSSISFTS